MGAGGRLHTASSGSADLSPTSEHRQPDHRFSVPFREIKKALKNFRIGGGRLEVLAGYALIIRKTLTPLVMTMSSLCEDRVQMISSSFRGPGRPLPVHSLRTVPFERGWM